MKAKKISLITSIIFGIVIIIVYLIFPPKEGSMISYGLYRILHICLIFSFMYYFSTLIDADYKITKLSKYKLFTAPLILFLGIVMVVFAVKYFPEIKSSQISIKSFVYSASSFVLFGILIVISNDFLSVKSIILFSEILLGYIARFMFGFSAYCVYVNVLSFLLYLIGSNHLLAQF